MVLKSDGWVEAVTDRQNVLVINLMGEKKISWDT